MFNKSHADHSDMRRDGFLKLPSGRTLNDYKNFNRPQSGWIFENIKSMSKRFLSLKLENRAIIGGLLFDEVKIKEGLVYDPGTFELTGFVSLDDDMSASSFDLDTKTDLCLKKLEEMLATHVLQFFFKSLFARFDYPCAYFMTRSISAAQLNRAALLLLYHFVCLL